MVRVAARCGRGDHRFERIGAVAPGAVHVKVAAQIGERDRRRKRSVRCGFDLADTESHLRRHVCEAERGVYLVFRAARDVRAGRDVENAVLADA